MLPSLVCLTTLLIIMLRAPKASSQTVVIAENTPRKLQVSLSHRHHLVLHHSCIFRRFRIQRKSSSVGPPVARAPSRSSQRSRSNSEHGSRQVDDTPMRERPRSTSAPQKRQPMTTEDVPPVPSHTSRTRAKSASASSSRNTGTPVSAGECYLR